MIGVGILTTPGVLSSYLTGSGQMIMVWVFGGLIAFFGAIVYGQMGSIMPYSGGEFYYLSRIYHPIVGIAAGWVSIIAGFAGPIALSAMAFAKYSLHISVVRQFFCDTSLVLISDRIIALLLVFLLSLFHAFRKRVALNFQLITTGLLIAFLLLISYWGLSYDGEATAETLTANSSNEGNFGVALLLSVYSYTGWNASCYFAGEIRNPKRNLPLSLFLGVLLVMGLYLAVNFGLIHVLGEQHLSGKIDFLAQLGIVLSGKLGSQIISATVLIILIASISSMIFTGSRIPLVGKIQDENGLAKPGTRGITTMHVLQFSIASLFILFTTFQQLLLLLTIILSFFSILTAFGIFLLPWKKLQVLRIQKVFVKFSALILLFVLFSLIINSILETINQPYIIVGAILVFSGIVIFLFFRKHIRTATHESIMSNYNQ
jgi:APA family basic amino acid/polyamine antiporter